MIRRVCSGRERPLPGQTSGPGRWRATAKDAHPGAIMAISPRLDAPQARAAHGADIETSRVGSDAQVMGKDLPKARAARRLPRIYMVGAAPLPWAPYGQGRPKALSPPPVGGSGAGRMPRRWLPRPRSGYRPRPRCDAGLWISTRNRRRSRQARAWPRIDRHGEGFYDDAPQFNASSVNYPGLKPGAWR